MSLSPTERRQAGPARILAVCSWIEATELALELDGDAARVATVVDVVDAIDGAANLVEAASLAGADTVVVSRAARGQPEVAAQIPELHRAGVEVRTLDWVYDRWVGKLPLADVEPTSLVFDTGGTEPLAARAVRRLLDVFVAVALLPAGFVLWLILVRRADGRGALVSARCHGRDGRSFARRRFRTDVGSFGRWLDASGFAALPEAWNVLRGDMAVVGPRPRRVEHVDDLSAAFAVHDLRTRVRPGMIGWADVKTGYAAELDDPIDELQYDFHYLRHRSLRRDCLILARTVRRVLRAPTDRHRS